MRLVLQQQTLLSQEYFLTHLSSGFLRDSEYVFTDDSPAYYKTCPEELKSHLFSVEY